MGLLACGSSSTDSGEPTRRATGPTSPAPEPSPTAHEEVSEAPEAPESSEGEGPDTVLVATDVLPLARYPMRAIDASWAGDYGAEMGGAEVELTLRRAGDEWRFVRVHREPGEPANRATGALDLVHGSLRSADGSISIRGADEGVLVLEQVEHGPLPADIWILYFRN